MNEITQDVDLAERLAIELFIRDGNPLRMWTPIEAWVNQEPETQERYRRMARAHQRWRQWNPIARHSSLPP